MNRNTILVKKARTKESPMDVAFITGFNRQYQSVEHIVRKYWPILKSDKTLSNILPKKTRFIYKRAPTLRNCLVHNIIDPTKKFKIVFRTERVLQISKMFTV